MVRNGGVAHMSINVYAYIALAAVHTLSEWL